VSNTIQFVRQAVQSYREVGSVMPSSRFLARKMTDSLSRVAGDSRAILEVSDIERAAERLEERRYEITWHHGLRGTDRSLSVLDPASHRVVIRRWWPWTLL